MMSAYRRIPLGPVSVTAVNLPEALKALDALVSGGGGGYVCFCESNLFVHANRNPEVSRALSQADMVLADGFFLVALAKLLGRPLPQRLPGPSFLLAACEHGLARGYRHFFYGGAPGVAEGLSRNLTRRFPGLIVAGTHSPPFRPLTPQEDAAAIRLIEAARPHCLWVALGAPKQELWVSSHLGRIDVPVQLAVGAAFDFHSGKTPWAPRWIRAIGFEWAFRMATGGRRVFWRNLRCVSEALLLLIRELWRAKVRRRS